MPLPSWFSRMPTLLSGAGQRTSVLLATDAWRRALQSERARVDRNGSPLSILTLTLPAALREGRPLLQLTDYLAERLRITDTIGWREPNRLGVLLPDTPRPGAEKVAAEIMEFVGDRHGRLTIDIAVYPDDSSLESPDLEDSAVDAADSGITVGAQGAESVLMQRMPLWKRGMDIVGASLGLVVAGPVILAMAAAVAATSRGGAFFLQEREGLGGRRFRMLKLRTMIADSDSLKERLRKHSVQDGPAFKMVSDPRVTPIGRLLRATSLDELPQLVNVLLGQMSLVGPRPLPVEESIRCEPWQRRRLEVTPGITCIWQVRGRSTVSFEEWMRMDLRYAGRRSPWLDLWLILATGPALVLSRGPR